MGTQATINNEIQRYVAGEVARAFRALKFARADGAAKDTNIAVADADGTNIGVNATLLAVLEVEVNTGALADHTEEASVTSDGNIQLDTTATIGDDLLVVYLDWDNVA